MIYSNKYISLLIVIFAISIGVTISGCDDRTIDAFEEQQGLYSIYGALEVGSSTNYIRIRKVDTPLLADSTAFEGTVTFTDLETGFSTELNDTIVEYNGNFTHNFLIDQLIEYDREYLVQVESPDGDITESIASTPQQSTVQFLPSDNINCETELTFSFSNVVEPEFIRMDIGVSYQGVFRQSTLEFVDQIRHKDGADEMYVELSPRHMLVEIFPPPLPDNTSIDPKTLNPTVTCFQIEPRTFLLDIYHFGKEWDGALPSRSANLDIESGDIQNGLGFFGGYSKQTVSVPVVI